MHFYLSLFQSFIYLNCMIVLFLSVYCLVCSIFYKYVYFIMLVAKLSLYTTRKVGIMTQGEKNYLEHC